MQRILIQLDTDPHPSTFDRVVAVDAGVDQIFSEGNASTAHVTPIVHGAMFTRGPKDLKNTAIFVGGSDVMAAEILFDAVKNVFFGPVRVSAMMDANGSNTTAAAAVLCASQHLPLDKTHAAILGGTGPVGLRSAELLARRGAEVHLYSRSLSRAESACHSLAEKIPGTKLYPEELKSGDELAKELEGISLLIAAGAAGVQFLSEENLKSIISLKVAVDLNAVPPTGLGGVDVTDKAAEKLDAVCYGAIGAGGLKMNIHKAAVQSLFESNDRILDTEEIYQIGETILAGA